MLCIGDKKGLGLCPSILSSFCYFLYYIECMLSSCDAIIS